jgi:uncharacterized protein YlxW (UPF0749 family)
LEAFKILPEESVFFDLNPDEISLIFYILGFGLAKSLTIDELRILGTGLFLTGEVLLTILAQRLLINDVLAVQQEHEATEKAKQNKKIIEELQFQNEIFQSQIQHLQQQVDQLNKK